jgi:hypothetical protein
MRAVLVRTGGFGGLTRRWCAEPPALTSEGEARLREAADRAGFFALPPLQRAANPAPDRFGWSLEVEDGARHHAVRFDEDAASDELMALVELVQDLAGTG